jgi:uncharacterized protein YigE (DUF2233 family)
MNRFHFTPHLNPGNFILGLLVLGLCSFSFRLGNDEFVTFIANPQKDQVKLYWKDDKGEIIRNFSNLKKLTEREGKALVFAMNGGMYQEDNSPLGLYIENQNLIKVLNKRSGKGNFYLQPNGVFYLTDKNGAVVCKTSDFKNSKEIRYATQSGPMLVVEGGINSAFTKGSANLNIRNGVGILPDGKILFAMSKEPINFYDFALFFKDQGCSNALYLDGFVSRTYLPSKNWIQTDGNFGVIIGITQ